MNTTATKGNGPLKSEADFTDLGRWTPQTFMLQAIAHWVETADLPEPRVALSIDDNPTLNQILLKRWPSLKIQKAAFPEHDAQCLTAFADNLFDIVYSNQVLEHIPKPWLAAKELVRVLKPGGLGIHTTCAFNPLHGPPAFKDFYRFFPDGLAELFSGAKVLVKTGWGDRDALIHNLTVDDGHGALGGRRFNSVVGQKNEELYPWVTWIIFQKETSETDTIPASPLVPLENDASSYVFDSERKEQLLVRSLVKPGMTVLDVGANVGKYTKLFSLLAGPNGRVFAFEPDPISAKRVESLVARDQLNNVKLAAKAVSERCGTVTLNQFPAEYCSWNSLGRPQMEDPKNPKQLVPIVSTVDVETVTLDEFCRTQGIKQVDYLKLDVEGAEFRALQGSIGLLQRQAIRYLQFEVSAKMLEGLNTSAKPVFDLLTQNGYECHRIGEDGQVLDCASDSTEFYENYLAVPVRKETKITTARTRNIVISGTNFWNPGDDFVRDGIIRVLHEVFPNDVLNFLFYNFNADFFPQSKFSGIGNYVAQGDLDQYRDHVDAVIIAGLSAGDEIKDLYRWVVANKLEEKVYLIGAGYENNYVEQHISQEPEATIFRKARLVIGRTAKTPEFIREAGIPYHHINCPAILSVPEVKNVPVGKQIERIGFSIQLPHGEGLTNHSCARAQYDLSVAVLRDLSRQYAVEVVAHHKTEYFHFLNLLRDENIPVIFSSFYQDLHQIYPRYDLVITTRLHSSLFANGHGIPGIIINDTDRHTHTLDGFQHSYWVNNRENFDKIFAHWKQADLTAIARESAAFKQALMEQYVKAVSTYFGNRNQSATSITTHIPHVSSYVAHGCGGPANDAPLTKVSMDSPELNVRNMARFHSTTTARPTRLEKLNIGCGPDYREGFHNIDGNANLPRVDEVIDIKPGVLPQILGSGLFRHVLAKDFLEHHHHWEAVQLLNDFHALLCEGGTLELFLPNVETIINDSSKSITEKKLWLYGGQDIVQPWEKDSPTLSRKLYPQYFCHRYGWTPKELGKELENLGFGEINITQVSDGWNMNVLATRKHAVPSSQVDSTNMASGAVRNLPVHFFTIVLNGQPFIRHHFEQMRQLPFRWHWHIVEGVAELNHDTAWSKASGGKTPAELHRAGLSVDGTTEYLDALREKYPDNITVYRPPTGKFWDGKREMVNAPLPNITAECLLWQVDADELWTATQIIRARSLFLAHPEKTAAMFFCHYFVGPKLIVSSRDTYGNHSDFEWLRVWRYLPGDRWVAHEPPRLHRGERDVASINAFRHAETEALGLVFQHYAYATKAQIHFKEAYYGYAGATAQWQKLQQTKVFPQRLADHFAWVKDAATVDTIAATGIKRLVPDEWLEPAAEKTASASPLDGAKRILFVRTDSIGDAVLASALLEPLRQRCPDAQLTVLCQEHIAELYAACPFVNSVICYNRKQIETNTAEHAQILTEIAAFAPDVVLNSVRSRDKLSDELTLAVRAAKHIALEGDLGNITPADHAAARSRYELIIPTLDMHQPELNRHTDFLRGLGIEASNLQPAVWTAPDDELLAEEFFKQQSLDPAKTIAVFPGAQHEVRVYSGYADALTSMEGYRFLVFGDESQNPLAEEMERQMPGRTVNLCGRTTLRETAALLRRCRLYVGAESAGAHIACAVGVPNVVVLGGGHFGRFMPYSPLTSAVALPLDCFGCNWGCRCERPHCIKDIPPELLAEAIRQTLKNKHRRPRVFLQPKASWPGGESLPTWRTPTAWLRELDVEIIGLENIATPAAATTAEPVVTAIISTYNSERFMAACMEDMVAQTILDKLEILVLDSGSQENERAIVERYQKKFPNIRYVRTEREPLYIAWNRAVKLARGKYVVNANTDDSRRPDAFEILLHGMEAHPDADLAYSHYGMTSKPNDPFPPTGVFRDVCHDPYHPAQLLFYCITGCLQFWRKTSLEKIGGFDERLKCVGDYEILLRFMRQGMKPLMVPDKLSCFYINREGLSFGSTTAGKEDMAIKERYRQEVNVSEIYAVDPNDPREMAKAWICLGNFAAKVPVPWADQPHTFYDYSINCYQQALRCDPTLEAAWHNLAVLALRTNITDFLIKTFSAKNQNIHAIVDNAKQNPKLFNYEFKPKVAGHIYRHPSTTPESPTAQIQSAKPSIPVASGQATVDWVGSFLDHGSLSHVNRELTRALSGSKEFKVHRVHNGAPGVPAFKTLSREVAVKPSSDAAVTIRHSWPPDWQRPRTGKLVVIQPWEFGALPVQWVEQARNVDEFWLPSEYVRRIYVESGVPAEKVFVVPNGVNLEKFNPQVVPTKLATKKRFKFLFVGGTIFRKGPDVLLKAYLENFTAADDVCLVIKDFGGAGVYAGQTAEANIRAAQTQPNAPEILYLNQELPPDALPGLYTACDCLVLPYRGEGFGLPVIEAMACGRPVIVTAGGATDDFVRDTYAWRIPSERKVFGYEISGMELTGAGWLLEPDPVALGQSMRAALANPSETRQRGQLAAEHAAQFFTWKNSATLAAQRLHALIPATKAKSTLPSCALIGHLGTAGEKVSQKQFSAAWASALQAITARPFHPEAYLLLAEIAQTVGAGSTAKLCAEHARALAPGWKPAKKFLNKPLKGDARPEWLKLPAVVQNSSAKAPSLSVCLIVKNEEKFLGQCLKSIRDLATQIVVVDTGSTDRTVAIAKEHDAEVHAFTWCNDFSAARNAALEHASGDWVLTLDADEEVPLASHEVLRKHLRDAKVMAWRLPIIDAGHEAEGRYFIPRLFRNAPGVFFAGRVHEHPFDVIEKLRAEWALDNRLGEAVIIHHGYTKELTLDRDKVARNLHLLELALPESPGNPVLLMSLGLELCRSGRTDEGLLRYDSAFAVLSHEPTDQTVPEFRETLLTQYASQLYAARHFNEVVRILSSPLATKSGLTASQHYVLGMAYIGQELFDKAAEQLRFCLTKRTMQTLTQALPEIRSSAPRRGLALCLSRTNDTETADKEFQQALAEDPHGPDLHVEYARFLNNTDRTGEALQLLYKLGAEKPDLAGIWIYGAQLALAQPNLLDISLDWTATAIQHLPENPQIIALRAEALMLAGQLDQALPHWKILEASAEPAALAAIILCETALKANSYSPPPDIVKTVEKEFIRWFQRLVTFKTESAVANLFENAKTLSQILPKCGEILTEALRGTANTSA